METQYSLKIFKKLKYIIHLENCIVQKIIYISFSAFSNLRRI